jgi:hypothetical protein
MEGTNMNLFTLTFSKGNTDSKYQLVSDGAAPTVEQYLRSKHGDLGRLIDFELVQIPMCYEGTDGRLYEISIAGYDRSGFTLIASGSSVTYPEKPKSALDHLMSWLG